MRAAADTPPAHATTTASAAESTAPSTTASEQAARRKQRREEAERGRRRREKQRSASGTTPESPPETAAETSPPALEPQQEPAPDPERTTPKRSAPPANDEPRERYIVENATLELVKRDGVTYWQEGTVRGTLRGTIAVKVTIGGPGVISTFTVTLLDGTVRGRGEARVRPAGSVVHYDGTASITGGTGTYARASGHNLRYSGTGEADGSRATARLVGHVRY